MVKKFINKGQKFLFSSQDSVFSAASIIMVMVIASRVLGLVRQRTLAHFFAPDELSLFFAAFRLPDLIFEVLVFGTFSSAFIPVFTRSLEEKGKEKAWEIASTIANIGLVVFAIFSFLIVLFADRLYGVFAPGFSPAETQKVAMLTRVLFAAQGFFVISYVLTAVLESLRRFLVPALAPLFYNLGIIIGTLTLSSSIGLMAPVVGVVAGAAMHFLIQLPLAFSLGFRIKPRIAFTPDVKKIGKLSLPRIIEVSFLQVSKTVELFLASLISSGSYAYFTFGNTLQLLPVGIFGTSIAKAALPTLARQSKSPQEFKNTMFRALNQVVFLTAPVAVMLMVLRIPIVRLVFGTDIFSWEATVQTSMVVSAFAFGVVFQAINALFARSFYALHDTRTPVVVSVSAILLNILVDLILIRVLHFPVWGLAAAFSLSVFIQACVLFFLVLKKIEGGFSLSYIASSLKTLVGVSVSGFVMYFLVKVFDRSVWVKRLSFLGRIEGTENIPFERFVLDTRYTVNLIILTLSVASVGTVVYCLVLILLRSEELNFFFNTVRKMIKKHSFSAIPVKEVETVTPLPKENSS